MRLGSAGGRSCERVYLIHSDRERPNHPFPMTGHLMLSNSGERPTHGSQEEPADKYDDRRLGQSAVRHEYAEVQTAQGREETGKCEDAPRPPVELKVAASNLR